MNKLFSHIEADMMNRRFLVANPVLLGLAAGTLQPEHAVRTLKQYVRLPEEIVKILLEAAGHFPRESLVQRELARNVAQESGYGTGGVPHVEILKHMLLRDLNIDVHNVTGSPATEAFITALHAGMQRNASYALGQAFALEASAVPELSIVVGPLINAAARCAGLDAPISQEALTEGGAYELKTIRTRLQALAMNADHWFAMHVKDFEVGHRDHLRDHAASFLLHEGDEREFEAGFLQVMDLMDTWWDSFVM